MGEEIGLRGRSVCFFLYPATHLFGHVNSWLFIGCLTSIIYIFCLPATGTGPRARPTGHRPPATSLPARRTGPADRPPAHRPTATGPPPHRPPPAHRPTGPHLPTGPPAHRPPPPQPPAQPPACRLEPVMSGAIEPPHRLSHREVLHRGFFYTQKLLPTDAFTRRHFYRQTLVMLSSLYISKIPRIYPYPQRKTLWH